MTRPAHDRTVPSDGLTLDTRRGPVDTVAVDRARQGHRVRLTFADSQHLTALLATEPGDITVVAQALGVPRNVVEKRVSRHRLAAAT